MKLVNHYHVYILGCSDGSYYTGITNNIERRLIEHQSGENPKSYTYKRRPIQLLFNEVFNDVNQAIAFEKQVKGWRREKKEAIISGSWDLLPELAKASKKGSSS
nr:putative endonuclease [Mucilaginibacter sp. SP1R1]